MIVACAVAMGFGTAAGGWRIVRTLGMRIVKLEPVHGFAAETGAAASCCSPRISDFRSARRTPLPRPIMGVGAIKRLSAVRWGVTTKILYAWIFTLPGAGLLWRR